MLRSVKIKGFALLVTFIVVSTTTSNAQTSSYQELQAAYIFNFAKYVVWPEAAPVFVVGVYGETESIEFLEKAFHEKRIAGKNTEVKVIENPEDSRDCNIIYVPESESKNLKNLLTEIEARSILVVTEEDLIKRGAGISFIVEDDRLKFKIKRSVLQASKLRASDGLLKLAIIE